MAVNVGIFSESCIRTGSVEWIWVKSLPLFPHYLCSAVCFLVYVLVQPIFGHILAVVNA